MFCWDGDFFQRNNKEGIGGVFPGHAPPFCLVFDQKRSALEGDGVLKKKSLPLCEEFSSLWRVGY